MSLWGLRILQCAWNMEVTATLLTHLSLVQRFFAVVLEGTLVIKTGNVSSHSTNSEASPDVYMFGRRTVGRSFIVIHWDSTLVTAHISSICLPFEMFCNC